MNADERRQNQSGFDIDVWGGEVTSLVLIPKPGEPCVLQDDKGGCPAGCCECWDFAEEIKIIHHGGTEDTEKRENDRSV